MKIIKSTVSTLLLSSLLTTGIVSGQTLSVLKKPIKSQQQTIKQSSSKYIVNLNELFRDGQFVPTEGFEREVDILERALASRDRKGTVLVDRSATKRVPVVNNLVARLASENIAPSLRGKSIVRIDLPQIFSDSKSAAEVSAQLDSALKQIEATGGRAILFIEDITPFTRDNPSYGVIVSERLRQSLVSGKINVISASTDEEYNQLIAADEQLNARFKKVDLEIASETANDGFVGDKLSPDLREIIAGTNPNQKVKVILQSDDIKNTELRTLLTKNGVVIEAEAEGLNMLVVEMPARVAEAVANLRGAKHLSLDREVKTLGHIAVTTGMQAMRMQPGNSGLDGTGVGIAVMDSGVFERHQSFLDSNSRRPRG